MLNSFPYRLALCPICLPAVPTLLGVLSHLLLLTIKTHLQVATFTWNTLWAAYRSSTQTQIMWANRYWSRLTVGSMEIPLIPIPRWPYLSSFTRPNQRSPFHSEQNSKSHKSLHKVTHIKSPISLPATFSFPYSSPAHWSPGCSSNFTSLGSSSLTMFQSF